MQLLQRCLTKDPFHRLRDIGDARIALETTTCRTPDAAWRALTGGGQGASCTAAVLTAVVVGVWGSGACFVRLRRPGATAGRSVSQ